MEVELEEFVFDIEAYEDKVNRCKNLAMSMPSQDDYISHVLHTIDLSQVTSYSQVIGLDHKTIDPYYTTVYMANGQCPILKVTYKEFKTLYTYYKEQVKRQQFNNK